MTEIENLFGEHQEKILKSTDKILSILNYRGLILGSGSAFMYFEDDMPAPFKTNAHFAHWCPANGPHHFIKYIPGNKPLLIYYSPDDFWHIHERLANNFWTKYFEIVEIKTLKNLWPALGDTSQCVFIGDETKYAHADGIKANCEFTLARLNWYRRVNSGYEIHCMKEANRKASLGHKAAKEAFMSGASEYEIYMKYLYAMNATDVDLPYRAIVGIDKNSAVLHYHALEHHKNGHVLLIDSGASYLHYPADITRTYTHQNAHSVFKQLVSSVNNFQQQLCQNVKVGTFFADLHYNCHLLVAQALHECGIIQNVSTSDYVMLVEKEITKTFFPHGLGHMLGIQVHDIGGKQLDEQGNPVSSSQKQTIYQTLRYIGTLEENNVVTIEPGIYFIPMLLATLSNDKEKSKFVNWKLVDELIPFGGIRIEDNVVPTQNGSYNITREFLDS